MPLDPGLQLLRRTRPRLAPGDIFAWQHARRPGQFHFGRVISTEANMTRIPEIKCVLIYLYRAWSPDRHAIPELRRLRPKTSCLSIASATGRNSATNAASC